MTYLLLGALLFAIVYRVAGVRALKRFADWRVASSGLAVALLAAAGFVGLRGGVAEGLALAAFGVVFAAFARWPRARKLQPATPDDMSLWQARATLGVGPEASADEIRAAYSRLIQRVHPDRGGAPGLAAHLNLARDILLRRGGGR